MPRKARACPVPSRVNDPSWLENLWDEPATIVPLVREDSATIVPLVSSDFDALQGAWLAVAGRRQAELLVSGDRLVIHFGNGDIYMGRFTWVQGRPATMDVRVEEGPPHHKGQLACSIWEVVGDSLRWCTASPGQPERPTDFVEADPQHLFLVFRREHTNGKR